jgi:hypothetical protein
MSREGYSSHLYLRIFKNMPAIALIFMWRLMFLTACSDEPEGGLIDR